MGKLGVDMMGAVLGSCGDGRVGQTPARTPGCGHGWKEEWFRDCLDSRDSHCGPTLNIKNATGKKGQMRRKR